MNKETPRAKQLHSVVVGKEVLELLSSAMYVDPLSIYREYVQNAVDSLDEAALEGLVRNGASPSIALTLDPVHRSALIRDNGIGIPRTAILKTLTAVGASKKHGTTARGFRGVGRLAGLGYCQELIMRSRASGEDEVTSVHWDCRRLRELLRAPNKLSLEEIISEIVSVERSPAGRVPKHFFEVEMRNLLRYKNDLLLNEPALAHYLSQVAPVPFSPSFTFGNPIQQYLDSKGAGKTYSLTLNGQPVFRPFEDYFEARKDTNGRFLQLEYFEVPGLSSASDAVGWILHSDYLGAIPDRHGIGGLRVRCGNIQIGSARLLDPVFVEPRFNAWAVGECHILSTKLIPNARRDDFEVNSHYSNLLNHITPTAKNIAKSCRDCSAARARERLLSGPASVSDRGQKLNWLKAGAFLSSLAEKPLTASHRLQIAKLAKEKAPTYGDVTNLVRLLIQAGNEVAQASKEQ